MQKIYLVGTTRGASMLVISISPVLHGRPTGRPYKNMEFRVALYASL